MPTFTTLEHTTLRDPQGKPRTVTVRESAARVLLARGYRRQGEADETAATGAGSSEPPAAGGDQPPDEAPQDSAPATGGRTRARRPSPDNTA